MKRLILSILALSMLVGFSGCLNSQLIKIKKEDDGSTSYNMSNEVPLPIKRADYRGYNIHDYDLHLESINNKVTVFITHDVMFTQGSGTPLQGNSSDSTKWISEKFYENYNSFEITGIESIKKGNASKWKSSIIDKWNEKIWNDYNKKEFINLINQAKSLTITINSARGEYIVKIVDMSNLNKFAKCLEDKNMCIDKK